MRERWADIPTDDGAMRALITSPEEGGPFPAVLFYMDFWGLREELFDIARRVATVGYCGVVADFYHRLGGAVGSEFRDDAGRMVSLDRLERERQEAVLAPMLQTPDAHIVADTGAILRFLGTSGAARIDAVGGVGWCMGGRHVLQAAGHYPQHFRAAASLHGTMLVRDDAASTHRLADRFRGEVYCGFGERDPYTPPATIAAMAAAMASSPARYRAEIHPGAAHGYALPDRDIYDKRATNRDWELIFAMFRRQMPARV